MDLYEIETGVQLGPHKGGRSTGKLIDTLRQLQIGDSFCVPYEDRKGPSLKQQVSREGKKSEKRFRVESREEGFRIFRLADRESRT